MMKHRVFLGVLGLFTALAACSKDETGTGGGAVGVGGAPACADTCAAAIIAGGKTCEGVSGEPLLAAVVSCAGGPDCSDACASFVSGTEGAEGACFTCLRASCTAALDACANDV